MEPTIKLGERGHYYLPTAGAGTCQFAEVVHANDDGTVNLAAWQHDGEPFRRLDVPVIGSTFGFEPDITDRLAAHEGASFHPLVACPFGK